MRRRLMKSLVLLVAAVLLMAALGVALTALEHRRAQTEQYRVYSAYLAHEFGHNVHDWGRGQGISLVILPRTQTAEGFLQRLAVPQPWSFIKQAQWSTRASLRFAGLFTTQLEPSFVLPNSVKYYLVTQDELQRFESAPGEFDKRFPGALGTIGLGAVGFNSDRTEALFHINHYCGLCGGGRYVLMKKTNGNWKVAAEHYTWVS
jgi:hypothetical protein